MPASRLFLAARATKTRGVPPSKKKDNQQDRRLKRLEGLVAPDREVYQIEASTTHSLNANGRVEALFDSTKTKNNSVILSNIRMKFQFWNLDVNPQCVRVIYFLYKANVVDDLPVTPGIINILELDDSLANYNPENKSFYRILRDKTFLMQGTTSDTSAMKGHYLAINNFKKQNIKAGDQNTTLWYPYIMVLTSLYTSSGCAYRMAIHTDYVKGSA